MLVILLLQAILAATGAIASSCTASVRPYSHTSRPEVASPRKSRLSEHYQLFEIYQKSDSPTIAKSKLVALAAQLRADQQYDVWLLSYGGKQSCPKEARRRAQAVKKYLVSQGLPQAQVKTIDAGFREEWAVELWLVIRGTSGPPSRATLKREQVTVIDPKGNERYRCPTHYSAP